MKPVYQTRFGKEGNCWAAVLASMLELPLEATDHCACSLDLTDDTWSKNTDALLRDHGLFSIEVGRNKAGNWVFAGCPPDGALLIGGVSTNRKLPHVVIVRCRHLPLDSAEITPEIIADHKERSGGQWQLKTAGPAIGFDVVHDPLPGADPASIVELEYLTLLCRFDRESKS